MEAELSACQVIDVIGNCSGFEIFVAMLKVIDPNLCHLLFRKSTW
jgi:hypothetical protein